MSTSDEVIGLRDGLVITMVKVRQWIDAIHREEQASDLPQPIPHDEVSARLDALIRRGSARLLTVAVIGEFSAGKSFLLSGLQGHLQDRPIRNEGLLQHRYTGVLPSSPSPTTSCPARLVAVAARSANLLPTLKVQFVGDVAWYERPVDEDGRAITAYATELASQISYRAQGDRGRQVAEVQVEIANGNLPVDFFDLPGGNSPDLVHEQIIEDHLKEADCFIYVTKATSTLSDSSLRQIGMLHAHYQATGKPVIWVVSGIDLAADIGLDDQPGWKVTVAQNNQYIRDSFDSPDGRGRHTFLNSGFIGVSPALEAQGRFISATDPEAGAHLIAASRMDALRDALLGLVNGHSGRRHLGLLREETVGIVKSSQGRLVDWLAIETLPLSQLGHSESSMRREIESLSSSQELLMSGLRNRVKKIRAELEKELKEGRLAKHLHAHVDSKIDSYDLFREGDQSRLEIDIQQEIRDWCNLPGGPYDSWSGSVERETTWLVAQLNELLSEVSSHGGLRDSADIAVDEYSTRHFVRSVVRTPDSDALSTGVNVASSAFPLAGAGLAAAGLVTGALVLAPVGVAIAIGGVVAMAKKHGTRKTASEVLRAEQKQSLDLIAGHFHEWLLAAVDTAGTLLETATLKAIDRERDGLASSLARLRKRRSNPDYQVHESRVRVLAQLQAQGLDLLTTLRVANLAG